MKSSIDAFEEAVGTISRLTTPENGLTDAMVAAKSIARCLESSNASLGSGWETVAGTIHTIENALDTMLKEIVDDMYVFIQETRNNENNIELVVNNANTLSNEILNELNLEYTALEW